MFSINMVRIHWKLTFLFSMAIIASLATFPYGFRFAYHCGINNPIITIILGIFFATIATVANTILGTYSLMQISFKKFNRMRLIIIMISIIGSIPVGFFCYFGYEKIIPSLLNCILSTVVVIVNGAIGLTAMRNLIDKQRSVTKYLFSFFKNQSCMINGEIFFCLIGFLIGIAVSSIGYLATVNGIHRIFISHPDGQGSQYHFCYLLSIFAWLPLAALYAHANATVTKEIYGSIVNLSHWIKKFNVISLLSFIFFLSSGTALAQIARETIERSVNITDVFITRPFSELFYSFIIPLALISSAAVNYFSTTKLLKMLTIKNINRNTRLAFNLLPYSQHKNKRARDKQQKQIWR